MESDGVETKMYADDWLEFMFSRLAENVDNTLFPKPPEAPPDPEEVIAENTAIFLDTSLRKHGFRFSLITISVRPCFLKPDTR